MEIFQDLKLNDIAKRPKIALIIDIHDWAFANIAKQLEKYLSEYFEFKIIAMADIHHLNMLIELTKDCELIHFFWRPQVMIFDERYVKNNLNISTAVYDHLFLDVDSLSINKKIFKISPNYYVSSEKLYNIYSNLPFCNKPKVIVEDGVDLNLFKPINIERFKNVSNREMVIGWCGNSKWASGLEDFKGVETILKPAIEQLVYEGYPIKMYFADKNEKMIPHNEMVNYYSNIDLYICTSKIEGTPNPILEAIACGIPIISTDVGIVPEVFGDKQKQFILKERSIQCLKEAIKKIVSESKIFIELSEENLMQIKQWDWSIRVVYFKEFFKYCLKNKN
ncbi:glycosyltransferase [Clostridium estertheticum]|uniref:glycosyltransferase n=1 Tax=Clostridium estertheticum TaxID=238834 RepID=UPI0013E91F30|nr:glycosyltransferase [Clostridium estertheticum]MBZ9686387.1 glycosyltransferase [Clostridium estertheticum]